MHDPDLDDDGGSFKTIDCVDVFIDGPGDHTVRPIRPSLLEHAKAERAKVYGSREPGPAPEKGPSDQSTSP